MYRKGVLAVVHFIVDEMKLVDAWSDEEILAMTTPLALL
jgi:hypothetical protein